MEKDTIYEVRTFTRNHITIEEVRPRSKKSDALPTYLLPVNVMAPDRPPVLIKVTLKATTLERAFYLTDTDEKMKALIDEEIQRRQAQEQNRLWTPGDIVRRTSGGNDGREQVGG